MARVPPRQVRGRRLIPVTDGPVFDDSRANKNEFTDDDDTEGAAETKHSIPTSMKPLISSVKRRVAAASVPSYTRIDGIKASMKRVSSQIANTGESAFSQDPFELMKGIHDSGLWNRIEHKGSVEELEQKLNGYYLHFLTRGLKAPDLRKSVAAASKTVAETLERVYPLESAEAKGTSSVNAPILRFARVFDDNVRIVLDWNNRVVIKEYAKLNEVLGSVAKYGATIADMATDVIIGGSVINQFVTHFRDVVTPHLVYQLDWFKGPSLMPGNEGVTKDTFKGNRVNFNLKRMSQYVIVERVDTTLREFVEMTQSGERPLSTVVLPTLHNLRALLAQDLYSLDVGWQTRRLLHQDFHLGNSMIRGLERELTSPYTGKTLVYSRARKPHLIIKAEQHDNLFSEIIDWGRSRAYIPISNDPGEKTLVLFGDNAFSEYGIHVAPELVDRSWDIRRLGYDLLCELNVKSLYDNTIARSVPAVEASSLLSKLKHWIVVASNLGHIIVLIAERFNSLLADTELLTAKKDKSTVAAAVKPLVERCKRIVTEGRLVVFGVKLSSRREIKKLTDMNHESMWTYTSDEQAAVTLFDEIAPLIRELPSTEVLASSTEQSSVKQTVVFDLLFSALFAPKEELMSGYHKGITAEYCLYDMPFFADMLSKETPELSDQIIQTGTLHEEDIIPPDYIDTGVINLGSFDQRPNANSEVPRSATTAPKRTTRSTAVELPGSPSPRRTRAETPSAVTSAGGRRRNQDSLAETIQCTYCGDYADDPSSFGVLVSSATRTPVDLSRVYCSATCAMSDRS